MADMTPEEWLNSLTPEELAAVNETINIELMSFPSMLSVNLNIAARLYELDDDDDPDDLEAAGQRVIEMTQKALDVTCSVTNTDPEDGRRMMVALMTEIDQVIKGRGPVNFDVEHLGKAWGNVVAASQGNPLPFPGE